MNASGTIAAGGDDALIPVEGEAWFDHQWGDFIAVGGGGWDWFAVNLDDGTDLTLSLVRDADGSYPLDLRHARAARRLVRAPAARGVHRHAARRVDERAHRRDLPVRLGIDRARRGARDHADADGARPGARHAADDGRHLLGGLAVVEATRAGAPLSGEAYVELTGYAPDAGP